MKTVINLKTDVDVKRQAQEVAKQLGIPLSTVINAYLKEFIIAKEFKISLSPIPSESLKKALREVDKDIVDGKNMTSAFTSAKEMDAFLDEACE